MTRGGLPHSDIFGSKLVCSSPKLFAACHVLHRLLAPRHSPYTLSSLTIRNSKLTLTHRLHVDGSCDSSMQHCFRPPPSAFASFDASARLRRDSFRHSAELECCGRKKLPFAEYSVVKDQHLPDASSNLLTSAADRRRRSSLSETDERRRSTISADVGVRFEHLPCRSCRVCVCTLTQRQPRRGSFARRNSFQIAARLRS